MRDKKLTSEYVSFTLRDRVFKLLDKNPLLTAKPLAKLLGFSTQEYQKHKSYLDNLKQAWKTHLKNERGSNRSNPDDVHNVFYKGELPVAVVGEVKALLGEVWGRAGADRWIYPEILGQSGTGWKRSGSKNGFLLYKSRSLGRIRLFNTGTVEIFVRKPANLGKCKQLFANAFTRHYLVNDLRVIDTFFSNLLMRFHATYKAGQRLPYMKVSTFHETHGLTWVMGDRTHPDCVEIIAEYHAEVEQARRLFDEFKAGVERMFSVPPTPPLGRDYSV